jgi:hypothetical protein
VIERNREANAILRPDPRDRAHVQAVVQQVVVGQRHAFRESGGAARELDVDRGVEVQLQRRQMCDTGFAAKGNDVAVMKAVAG